MPLTYLVGYDGSDAARAAIRVAAQIAAASGAEVAALTAHPSPAHLLLPGTRDARVEDAQRRAEELVAALDDPAVSRRLVRPGSPAKALVQAAAEEDAALVAVGAPEHDPLGRLTHSTTAERLLHGSSASVLVVPDRAGTTPIATVAVAYDASPEAEAALEAARGLAGELGAGLVLLAVAEPLLSGTMDSAALDADLQATEQLRVRIEDLAATMGAEARVHRGDPGSRIADACREGIDLLVCGSRAYGPLRAVLLGSVSRHLVDHAPCPVLVVPRPAVPALGDAGGTLEEAGAL